MIKGRRILVTGGTGSFGHHIVRRLMKLEPKEIRIFRRDEKKQYDMNNAYANNPMFNFVLGDIRNKDSVLEATAGIEVIFQAAALKQVPNCEDNPYEAVLTNIAGAQNVIQAALHHRVETVIAISTDKAVKPVNVMGMTKALQERLITQANFAPNNKGTKLGCVRYGNVLGSRGSVIPFFRNLLEQNDTLPITHPQMTRFLLTLSDAIDLVLYATENIEGGEIFVRKAPAGKILDLAKILHHRYGKDQFKYHIVGVRPGEKIHEVLVSEEEMLRAEDLGDYYTIKPWKQTTTSGTPTEYSSNMAVAEIDVINRLLDAYEEEANIMTFN
jgi:UDP-N-acetylglucosamine 4,6-dehydratase/5-epimerase